MKPLLPGPEEEEEEAAIADLVNKPRLLHDQLLSEGSTIELQKWWNLLSNVFYF